MLFQKKKLFQTHVSHLETEITYFVILISSVDGACDGRNGIWN